MGENFVSYNYEIRQYCRQFFKKQFNMKRKILRSAFFVALFTIASYGTMAVYKTYANNEITSNLLTCNVEALASPPESSEQWSCWSELRSNGAGVWRCGVPCEWEPHKMSKKGESKCYK